MVKWPSSLTPRNRSSGLNNENQRGGIFQVEVRICETLSSTISWVLVIESSIDCGIKNLTRLGGRVDLKSSNAAQHLAVVDQGATYLLPSWSNRWAPSGFNEGDSLLIVLVNARFCSSKPVADEIAICDQCCWSWNWKGIYWFIDSKGCNIRCWTHLVTVLPIFVS